MSNHISGVAEINGVVGAATVTLIDADTNTIVATTTSDSVDGGWSFPNLAAGLYEVLILKDGYKPQMHGPWLLDGTDSFFDGVAVGLHMNGTDASTTFTDITGKTWTAHGNAQIDTAQSKFGGASGLFDGAGDAISTPAHSSFDFGTGDFSIEFFARFNALGTENNLIAHRNVGSPDFWFLRKTSADVLFFGSTAGGGIGAATTVLTTGTWYHIALTRFVNRRRLFINGVFEAASNSSSVMPFPNFPLIFGAGEGTYANSHNGWLDDLRITKGYARYLSNFTVPASAFPDA